MNWENQETPDDYFTLTSSTADRSQKPLSPLICSVVFLPDLSLIIRPL